MSGDDIPRKRLEETGRDSFVRISLGSFQDIGYPDLTIALYNNVGNFSLGMFQMG